MSNKDRDKLVKYAVEKCLVMLIAKSSDMCDEGKSIDSNLNKYYIACASLIDEVLNDINSITLSVDRLNEIDSHINGIKDQIKLCNESDICKGPTLKNKNRMLKIYENMYSARIRMDVEDYVNDKMKQKMNDAFAETKSKITKFKHKSDDKSNYTYINYIRRVFEYQYKFAQRSSTISEELLFEYSILCEEGAVDDIIDNILSADTMQFTFVFNPVKPLELSIKEIDDFKSNVVRIMELSSQFMINEKFIATIVDFPKDSKGRFKRRNDLEALFRDWDRYLTAYDLFQEGLQPEEIYPKLNTGITVEDEKKSVESYVSYAKRYIRVAEAGTFPHID